LVDDGWNPGPLASMCESSPDALLRLEHLNVAYATARGYLPAVRDWTMSIASGQVVGIIGESGSGKTTAALAVMGLLPRSAVVSGSVRFCGVEQTGAEERARNNIRGARISLIQQEPLLSLNPAIRVVDQVAEVLRAHIRMRGADRKKGARQALERVGLVDEPLQNAYPHQLSGGQRQRVLIAQAIVCGPSLVIADEPTGALDVVSALEVMKLLQQLVLELKAALMIITHDPRLLAMIAERVLVVHAGQIVREGPASEVLRSVVHESRLSRIGGLPLLRVQGLAKTYLRRRSLLGRHQEVEALRGVNLELQAGRTLAVVGPTGSGKSTLARCIAGLEHPDAGEVLLDNRECTSTTIHRRIQMIFQDPGGSLNPRFTVAEALAEPLAISTRAHVPSPIILERLRQVGLPESAGARVTSQLSGGQKARLAIARALAALGEPDRPGVLLLDESLSALDLSVQTQIIELLLDLQQRRNLAYILIAHDLALVARLADEVVVLSEGRVVERGAPHTVFENPIHAQWRQLVEADRAIERGDARRDA
jgi:peptide/nickel transport system ATP-binding protein